MIIFTDDGILIEVKCSHEEIAASPMTRREEFRGKTRAEIDDFVNASQPMNFRELGTRKTPVKRIVVSMLTRLQWRTDESGLIGEEFR